MNVIIIKFIYYVLNLLMSYSAFSGEDSFSAQNSQNNCQKEANVSVANSDFINETDCLKLNSKDVLQDNMMLKS